MRDFFNREFESGQTVVWPMRQGSKMWMNSGVIAHVFPTELIVDKITVTGSRRVCLKNIKTVTILKEVVA